MNSARTGVAAGASAKVADTEQQEGTSLPIQGSLLFDYVFQYASECLPIQLAYDRALACASEWVGWLRLSGRRRAKDPRHPMVAMAVVGLFSNMPSTHSGKQLSSLELYSMQRGAEAYSPKAYYLECGFGRVLS